MQRHLTTLLLVTASLLAFSATASAQNQGERRARLNGSYEFQSPRLRAMQAYIGGGSSNGALYANPAGLITTAVYSLEAGYQHATANSGNALHGSIVDSKTNGSLAAGFGYSFGFSPGEEGTDDDNVRDHDIRAGLAIPLVPQMLSLGAAAHFTARNRGRIATDDGEKDLTLRGLTADVGLMATFNGQFALGVVGQNLIAVQNARDLQRGVGVGAGLFLGNFHLEAEYRGQYRHSISQPIAGDPDGARETTTPADFGHGAAVGAEYVLGQIPLRVGYSHLPFGQHRLGAGLGYRSQAFGMDAAYEQNLEFSDDRRVTVSFSGYF